jgi:putative FmdB family regulatory protein
VPAGYQEDDVPTYVYACTECNHGFEAHQAFTDDALTTCPECGGKLRKVFNSVGIVFKGSGFYRNDSRGTTTTTTAPSTTSDSSVSSSSSDSKSSTTSSSGSSGSSGDSKTSSSSSSSSSAASSGSAA